MGLGSRIREKSPRLFNVFAEVVGPSEEQEGWILQKFPDDYTDQEVLKVIPMFCFPTGICNPGPVQQFCFVLTDVESKFVFGFCRLSTEGKHCICILSYLPWHDLYYKMLNYIMELMTKNPSDDSIGFLRTAYQTVVPSGGEELHVIYKLQKVEFQAWCPDMKKLPTIPENRAMTEFYNALDVNNMITIFASLLNERRIIITSNKLGRLTACVMACNTILYPMHWQWIFVTVLPKKLLDHVIAPMPYIIGVPGELLSAVLEMDLGEVVIVDCDQRVVKTPHKDVQDLPSAVVSSIRNSSGNMFGDGVARAFMRALVELIGGYRFGLSFPPGEKCNFDMEKFIRNRPAVFQPFLVKLVNHQMFRQFIDERLELLNKGEGFSDEFEQEVSLLIDQDNESSERSSIAAQYRRWSTRGGNLLKSVTNKMKDRSKEAVKRINARMQEVNVKDNFSIPDILSLSDTKDPPPGSPNHRRLFSTNTPTSGSLKTSSMYLNEMNRMSVMKVPSEDEDAFSDKSFASTSTPEKMGSQILPETQDILTDSLSVSVDEALIDLEDEADKRKQKVMEIVNQNKYQIPSPVMIPMRNGMPGQNQSPAPPSWPRISLDEINSRKATLLPAIRSTAPQQTRSVFYDNFPANISGYSTNPRFVGPASPSSSTFYRNLTPGANEFAASTRADSTIDSNNRGSGSVRQPIRAHPQNPATSSWENFDK
ncbi:DENN domain-containing protein 1A-like [Paramacrobiotus metropolitanus]|uniref:DENN domain-containing protein 1A-like n=1 Tax=Paramacrobiotus metropolitanus TaxID=2943436 RepID=UPI0024464832|nr:DENN domain-containing protein 1A-like [Paramacrobiotus metropolitanus]